MDVVDFASGAAGGVAMALTGHPFDTVKVALQTGTSDGGMVGTFRNIARADGLAGLYRGVQSPLVGMVAMNAVVFMSFGATKRVIARGRSDEQLTTADFTLAGAGAGAAVAFVEGPADLTKCQQQQRRFPGLVSAARGILQQNGVRGLYQGFGAVQLRNVPANALWFGGYEHVRRRVAAARGCHVEQLPAYVVLAAGGFGGVLYWVTTYPVDVVKTVLQCEPVARAERTHGTMARAAQHIWATQGVRGFFRGFTPCLARAIPANGSCFYAYELTRGALTKRRNGGATGAAAAAQR